MNKLTILKSIFAGSVCAGVLATAAFASGFNIPAGDLATALDTYSQQTGVAVLVSGEALKGVRTKGARGELTADAALASILSGTGFVTYRSPAGEIGITREEPAGREQPSMRLAAAAATSASVETVVVTSSKIKGDIQTVPIAITALSQEQLTSRQIAGGPDLVKEVPNLTFSKTNFSGYTIQIRGIGTQAVSVTTDPAVAVAFNDTPFIRNHFFEQEFYDVAQVEVLRGPQGTLYGRNATAGVVNVVSAKPTDHFEAMASADFGNYHNRRYEGMVNIPIVDDRLDLRIAGEWTKRDGYDFNTTTGNRVDGRDLWSSRVTLGFKPVPWLHGDAVWEHFQEDDNRQRTGKQLCHHDSGPSEIGGFTLDALGSAFMSQGCLPGSLYDAGAFGTPNGLAIPFILGASAATNFDTGQLGYPPGGGPAVGLINGTDPYGGMMQSRNLRTIASIRDPKFHARNDTFELNADINLSPRLTLTSQTGYNKDTYYSTQDYNRFDTVPVFNDSTGLVLCCGYSQSLGKYPPDVSPGGIFCDPQLGCSDSVAGFDISEAKSWQFSQELRLASNYDGPLNFSFGANYLHYRTDENYYVLFNVITALAEMYSLIGNSSADITKCTRNIFYQAPIPIGEPGTEGCIYIDPNPLDKINGQGHNYFRSDNPYTLDSWASFGEVYYQLEPDVKLTAGLRFTDDSKRFTPVPSETLLSSNLDTGGTVDRGYPALPDIKQNWGEFTGRFVAEWSPKLDFTDQSMFYTSYSRGYKGGGANPPGIGFSTVPALGGQPFVEVLSYPQTFKPEFVNAYELGTKNTLLDGSMTLNGDIFFYDYKDYQISQIVDRTAVNQNFGAKIWGSEVEATWEPIPGLRFNLGGGYQGSRVDNNQYSIDLMDRLQGHAGYTILKPFLLLPSNCVVQTSYVIQMLEFSGGHTPYLNYICPGSYFHVIAPLLGIPSIPTSAYPNQGQGFFANVGGNQLPNTPHFTVSFGAEYGIPLDADWTAVLHGDFYWQDRSFARIYNDHPYDVLHPWSNVNLSVTVLDSEGWQFSGYVKNVFDTTAITGDFLNSDDSALTTNIFTTDPRLYGLRITKNW